MDLTGIPTPKMDWDSTNLPEAWKKFQQHVQLIFDGPLKDKDEEIKCKYLLLWVGDKGRDVFNTWPELSAEQAKTLNVYFNKFKSYVQPKLNPVFARYKFNNILQNSDTTEQFVTRLKLHVQDCNYGDPDEMVRDRIVFGTSSTKVRERLINEGEKLTLVKAIEISQSYEYSQEQLRLMSPHNAEVHAVSKPSRTGSRSNSEPSDAKYKNRNSNHRRSSKQQNQQKNPGSSTCGNCGYTHKKADVCPAKGKRCDNCNKWNHFSKVCRSVHKSKSVHEVTACPESDTESDFYIDSIESNYDHVKNQQAFAKVNIGPKSFPVDFKLDTGSQANILPEKVYNKLGSLDILRSPQRKLSAYDGGQLRTLGVCRLSCTVGQRSQNLEFYVVDTEGPPILGLQSCLSFELIKLVYSVETVVPDSDVKVHCPDKSVHKHEPDGHSQFSSLDNEVILKRYSDVFSGIGLFPGEIKIHIDQNAVPVVHPPRRVPFAIRDKLKSELERMEQADIIAKVTEPTKWVNSLVVVEKRSGKLRICLDPQDLNKAILRPHYPMHTLDDILPQLSGAKFFTKLDARSGYWALKLDEESSFLTTFNTPFGRYRFHRLPFGLKSSQDEFQRKIDECFEGLSGVVAIVDDILVFGSSRAEHDQNLRSVLARARDKGIRFNEDKLEVGVTELSYFGHVISSQGLKPDPLKVNAVSNMKPPQNKAELETILGMVNYLAKFAPNLSEITSPMRKLLNKDVQFSWDHPQERAFNEVKKVITQCPGRVLAYYDPGKEVTLQVDASKFGLGATLMQDKRPIAFASKSLTSAEVNYAQIEKEMLAILFGCKHFHQYVYGHSVRVETDHKPLVSIVKKPISAAPPRLQRMLLQLQRYDIDLYHLPGKSIPVADTLSRKFLPDTYPHISEGLDLQVHSVLSSLPISERKLEAIRSATCRDEQLSTLAEIILNGWPESRKECSPCVVEYWNHRDELSFVSGLILKGNKIVMPKSLRTEMLEKIHAGHMGIDKCLSRARDIMFWPKMSSDIQNLVSSCKICLESRRSNQKEPLISHEIPDYPWQIVATDLFAFEGQDYLVVVDYLSRYFEYTKLRSTSSSMIINELKSIFARFGIPEKVVSDNGPQYSSYEFEDFSKKWNFDHITSSPRYPQSNGLAERTVQTVKRLLKKTRKSGTDPLLAVLEYRTTPLSDTGCSPSQVLMSKKLRSVIPCLPVQLVPETPNLPKIKSLMRSSRLEQKNHYDVKAKPLKPLVLNETVRIQGENKSWKPAVVVDKHNTRSYTVRTADGAQYTRNRRHLLKTNEPDLSQVSMFESFPNVLDNQNSSPMVTNNHDHENLEVEKSDINSPLKSKNDSSQGCYITRSGRAVKPKTIVSM